MALRVLLADESSTIKKAIQMVLSDYGVEIKTVPTGIDVLTVTQSFGPDIIIADVLLNKKNGYEVCQELKKNNATRNIPVILMWSSFMQLDPQLFKDSGAEASLEKPFDTETIRALVEKLVPKLQTFPLKGFLNFAPLPDFEESDTFIKQKNDFATLSEAQFSENKLSDAKSAASSFALPAETSDSQTATQNSVPDEEYQSQLQNDEWTSAKTNQFVIETENFGDFEEVKTISSIGHETEVGSFGLQQKINEQIKTYLKDSPVATHRAKSSLPQKNSLSNFDEQLMKEEIRQIAEKICWQLIPDITEKIVREELNKLLEGIEKNI